MPLRGLPPSTFVRMNSSSFSCSRAVPGHRLGEMSGNADHSVAVADHDVSGIDGDLCTRNGELEIDYVVLGQIGCR